MRIKCMVLNESARDFVTKRGQPGHAVQIACLDVDHGQNDRLKNTFDYALNQEEAAKLAGKLVGQTVVVVANDVEWFASRLKLRGRLELLNGQAGKV